MRQINIYLVLCFLIILSCRQINTVRNYDNKTKSANDLPYLIDIKNSFKNFKSVPLSSIVRELEYIPLETTPASILRIIDHVALSDSFIFVNDHTKLLQFDKQGKFIRQIGSKGRGPAEYLYINDFCIGKDNKNIYILNAGNILEYNFNGLFIRSITVERNSTRFVLSDTNKIMLYPFNLPGNMIERSYSWYLTDLNGINILKIPNYFKRVHSPGMLIREAPLYSFDNNFHFMEYGIDTLYFIRNSKPEPYAIFNLGNMKMDHDLAISASDRTDILKRLEQKLRISSILENTEYLFFRLNWGYSDSSICAIFNKKTLTATFLKENGFSNDIDGGLTFWPEYLLNDSILVDCKDPFDFLKNSNRTNKIKVKDKNAEKLNPFGTLINNLTETSNPVLIVCRMKKN
jgi:hypothetical protein